MYVMAIIMYVMAITMYVILLYIPLENLHIAAGEIHRRDIEGSKHMRILYYDDPSVVPTPLTNSRFFPSKFRASTYISASFLALPPLSHCLPATFEPLNCSFCHKAYLIS